MTRKKNPADKLKVGRGTLKTPEVITVICERLSKGEPLACICRDEGMPADRTVRDWVKEDAGVSAAIACAREAGFDVIAADCLAIADDSRNDYIDMLADAGDEKAELSRVNGEAIQRARLRVETRLKLLAKWDPKRYGEKIDHNHGVQPDNQLAELVSQISRSATSCVPVATNPKVDDED